MSSLIWFSLLLATAMLAGVGGYLLRRSVAIRTEGSVEAKVDKMIAAAKDKQRDILLRAKDKAIKIIDEAKEEEKSRRRQIHKLQQRLEKREELFDKKLLELEDKKQSLYTKIQDVEKLKKRVQEIKEEHKTKLQEISGLNKEEAKKLFLDEIEKDVAEEILSRRRKLENREIQDLEREATLRLAQVMQRCAISQVSNLTTTTVAIPSDEMKGRIIGKEGRNIRVIEQMTGVDVIVDDTPMAVTLSCFSPIRREVAKRALEELIQDGRIHPARIEDAIERSKKEIALEIKKAGEDVLYELGITGIDPKLVQILGRLKYRTSYGQNVLLHSKEVALIATMLAEELGADVSVCKKGGLFHDIGKAVDHDMAGGHPEIGYNILKKFGFSEEICSQTITHHQDNPETIEGIIIKVADAVSGARPGARNDSTEKYLQRLAELEELTTSFEGVEKAYAIQAGREIRVFVRPESVDDLKAQKLAKEIAQKIETELKYPGEIKVNVIRETRVVEYAR